MNKYLDITIIVLFAVFFLTNNVFAEPEAKNIWQNKLSEYSSNNDVHSLIFVKCIKNTSEANIELYKKSENNNFELLLKAQGFIGKNGLGKEKEGDLKSPIGDFGIIQAFGIKPNPDTKLEYLAINENHYCCDENCQYYNKIIDVKQVNHKCKGEHIIKYIPQYNYAFFIDYNKEGVYPKGSAIFMHCKGKKPYTAGCVAVDEEIMANILKEIDSYTRVCIYNE